LTLKGGFFIFLFLEC